MIKNSLPLILAGVVTLVLSVSVATFAKAQTDGEILPCEIEQNCEPSPSEPPGATTNIRRPKVSPTPAVLGTAAPAVAQLPATGADLTLYYFLTTGSLGLVYGLKKLVWKK